jgi:hypothetical protein
VKSKPNPSLCICVVPVSDWSRRRARSRDAENGARFRVEASVSERLAPVLRVCPQNPSRSLLINREAVGIPVGEDLALNPKPTTCFSEGAPRGTRTFTITCARPKDLAGTTVGVALCHRSVSDCSTSWKQVPPLWGRPPGVRAGHERALTGLRRKAAIGVLRTKILRSAPKHFRISRLRSGASLRMTARCMQVATTPALPHSRTLALSHFRTFALSHSRTLALSHSRTLALSHSRTLALSHSRTLALSHSRTHALSHFRTFALSHSRTLALPHSRTFIPPEAHPSAGPPARGGWERCRPAGRRPS